MPDLIPEDPLSSRLKLGSRLLASNPKAGYGYVSDVRSGTRITNRQQNDIFATLPPYYPTIRRDGSGFIVTVGPGAIGYWNANMEEGQDPLIFETPTLNGQPLTATPPPTISVGANQWVVLHVITDKKNQITETPTVITSDDLGVHYTPAIVGLGEDESVETEGREGEYFIKLFRVSPSGQIDHRMFSDPILSPYLWTAEVKGDGKGKILIKYNPTEGQYEFRSLKRGGGILIEQEEEFIKFKLDGENVGDGNEVYIEPGGDEDKAKFRSIKAHDDGGLSTETEGNNILIRGNSKIGYIRMINCDGISVFQLDWADGLITTEGSNEIRVGSCCDFSGPEAPGP